MKTGVLSSFNFEGARVNYLANADNHANLKTVGDLLGTVEDNKGDIFEKYDGSNKNATLNIYANAGDFFVNPSQKGWRTHGFFRKSGFERANDLTNGKVQVDFFKTLLDRLNKASSGEFAATYTPGNHDFDGGDKMFYDLINKVPEADVIISNIDSSASPYLQKFARNINFEKVYSVKDDKTDKLHKVLALGVTIPSMEFYNPELLKGTKFIEHSSVKDVKIEEKDLTKTFKQLNARIQKFKNDNPDGAVVLSSHTGRRISEMIANNVDDIDVILDGHGHTDENSVIGRTHILSLGWDNEFVKTFRIDFDDNGKYLIDDIKRYNTKKHNDNVLSKKLQLDYLEDIRPLIVTPNEVDFNYDKSIRWSNSLLANMLTSATKESLNKISGNAVDIMGIQSSIIRGGLKNASTNMDVLKVFDGVSEDLSGVMVGDVTGATLAMMIFENIRENLQKPDRNTIIHWSDVKIDRTAINEVKDYSTTDFFAFCLKRPLIQTRNNKGVFEPIRLEKMYTVAIADKYLKKNDIEMPKRIRGVFKSTGETYNTLFNRYLIDNRFQIPLNSKFFEERIV